MTLVLVVAGIGAAGIYAMQHRTQPATWYLPQASAPDSLASTLDILVNEVGCTSGDGAEGNMADPRITTTADAVIIDVRTYARYGSQNCKGAPLAPLRVDIGEPIGDRVLVDPNGSAVNHPQFQYPDLSIPQNG
jgi:hypothetical protein